MSIAASNPARPAGASSAAAPPRAIARPVAAPVASVKPAAVSAASASTSAPMFAHLLGADTEEELRLQLGDLPRMSTGMHVEGFKPTLLSRVFGLFNRS